MSSRPLSLVSAGHPGRAREINHSRNGSAGSKSNRNGNSNRKQPRTNWNVRRGAGNGNMAPFPSAGKSGQNLLADEPLVRGGKSRGTSLNHLLSFQSYESTNHSPRKTQRGRTISPRTPKGKEDYVQSTAQFIVKEGCELEVAPFQADPDIPVPWKFIEAIRLFGQEETECPICLHPPIAAKVGRCGHAHCSSCILKLISITEYPECPICQCDIKQTDLRSVICAVEKRPKTNSTIEFVKMKRAKDSVVAVPQSNIQAHWLDRYKRVVPINTSILVENILDREEVELVCQESDCESSEVPFIEQAKELLNSRRAGLIKSDSSAVKVETTEPVSPDIFSTENPNVSKTEEVDTTNEEVQEEDNSYYFYQTVNCGNVFLASLNAKCLITQYGSLKDAPDKITATMLEIDDYSMDQDVRRRFRYLGHLSLGEAFSLVYVDHEGLGLSAETFEKHRVQIQQRKKRQRKKDHDENKASRLAEEYYDRELYGKFVPADISLTSHEMFPDFNSSFEETPAPAETESKSIPIRMATAIKTEPSGSSWHTSRSPMDSPMDWPAASPHKSQSPSFWGEMKRSSKPAPEMQPITEIISDDDTEERRAPDFRCEFAADLYTALEAATSDKKDATADNAKKPKKGQKKKKGRVIFST